MDRGQCKFHQDLTKNRLIFVSASECYPPREIQGSCDEYALNVCHPVVFYIKNVTNKILSTVGSIIQITVFACETVQFGSHVPMFWATSNLRAHECSTLKTEAGSSSKMLVPLHQTTQFHILEHCSKSNHTLY